MTAAREQRQEARTAARAARRGGGLMAQGASHEEGAGCVEHATNDRRGAGIFPAPHTDAVIEAIELPAAVEHARRLAAAGGRRILGIAGAPGAGKSTLAARLAAALGERAAVVPMDGFHLAGAELERLGRADRKGAQDTFDAAGFVALLRRLRAADEPVVYAPAFRRAIEEPIAGAVPVAASVPLVISRGQLPAARRGRLARRPPAARRVLVRRDRRGGATRPARPAPRRVRQGPRLRRRLGAAQRPGQRAADRADPRAGRSRRPHGPAERREQPVRLGAARR